MKKLVVVDGNSIMNRAFYGLSGRNMLMTKAGLHTNAVYGFLTILFKILNEDKPEYLAVAFDLKEPTFRHKKYTAYKANRKGMPNELAEQMPVIKEVLDNMNICRVELAGYEADDILGTLAKKAKNENIETILFTGDRDSFQLIEDGISVKLPSTKGGKTETEKYDVEKIKEKYGLLPTDLIEVKGLMGDTSDNIPGVPGIGEKTALSYISEFKSIENLYENIDNPIIKPKSKEALIEFKDLAFLSRELATIDTNIPINFSPEEYLVREYNNSKLFDLFTRLEFLSLIKKLNLTGDSPKKGTIEISEGVKISDIDEIRKLISELKEFAFYIDLESLKSESPEIGISEGNKGDFCVVLPANEKKEMLKLLFENEADKYGIGLKNLYVALKKEGVTLKSGVFDLEIAEYVINPNKVTTDINKLAFEELGIDLDVLKEENKEQMSLFDLPKKAENVKYFSAAAKSVRLLKDIYEDKIKENNQTKLFYEIEMPLVEVLAEMQIAGVKVEKKLLYEYGEKLQNKINMLTGDIYGLAGQEFNINSPKQLGDILFEKLKLTFGKKTKSGYATDADTLERIKGEHPIIEKVLEYKQLVKLKSTYADGLGNVIDTETGRIHSNFNQTITATGRLSSTEPNLQNIPIKMEQGKEIRRMFVPDSAYVFVDADYSQIELRVLAAMADDKVMMEAFNNDEDIHTTTAMQIFHLKKEEVTPALRSRAKTVNFGIVYGQGDFSLGQELGIPRREAKEYIESYLEHFSGIRDFMQTTIKQGKNAGFVRTLFERRRYIPEINSSNFNMRSFGERIAMNMPIQGTAADIIKIAMIKVYNRLKGMKSRLILQVHDELIIEAAKDEADEVKAILKDSMENAVTLKVKLKADIGTGESWLSAKS